MTRVIGQRIGQTAADSIFYVYVWIRPDTGEVFYVGKGHGDRAYKDKKHNPIFMNIIRKLEDAGLTPEVRLLHDGLNESEAFALEMVEIAKIGRIDLGTGSLANLTDGGEGTVGALYSEERRTRHSQIIRSALSSPELKQKWREAQVKRFSDPEQRRAASVSVSLRYNDPLERQKTSDALKGKPKSAEHVQAVMDSLRQKWDSGEMANLVRAGLVAAPPGRSNTSGFKGVSYDKSTDKWLAQIQVGKRTKHLGRHKTKELAALAYDRAAFEYFGKGAYQNFPKANNDN